MKHLASTIARLDRRRPAILAELHRELRQRVVLLLADLRGRFTPYCGFRDAPEQAEALAAGTSNARFGESPHNYRPALACDVVLHPGVITLPETGDTGYPNLWTHETEEAAAAWHALDIAAEKHGLERIMIRNKNGLERDWPHLQLHGWKSLIRR